MEEKKSIKISLSTVLLIIAILIIVIMCFYIYIQKQNSTKKIENLESDANNMKSTINSLQEKLNNINNIISQSVSDTSKSNTANTSDTNNYNSSSENIQVDYTLNIEDLKSIDSNNNYELKNFFNKYAGKKVNITGYVSNYGNDAVVPTSTALATYINIGDKDTYKDKIYAGGYTFNKELIQKINSLKIGQKITLIGTVVDGTWPLDLEIINISN